MANFTSTAIKISFLKLLNERPLNKISVKDIVEDCGINRNSFYYHFQDIPTLLEEIITELTSEIIKKYPSINSLDECFHDKTINEPDEVFSFLDGLELGKNNAFLAKDKIKTKTKKFINK